MKESSSDPANYTGKTLSDDQKLKLLTVKFSFPHGFKFPTTAGGVSNYHGWRNGHSCVTALEMTQLAVFQSSLSNNTSPNESPFISKDFKNWKNAGAERLDAKARSEGH